MAIYDVVHNGEHFTPDGRLPEETPKHTHCADCGEALPTWQPGMFTSGSAVLTDDAGRELARVCYTCAHAREYDFAKQTGRLFAYLTRRKAEGQNGEYHYNRMAWYLTSWGGGTFAEVTMGWPYTSNFGDKRYPFTFTLDGEEWYGVGYGGEGCYARCRRCKRKGV